MRSDSVPECSSSRVDSLKPARLYSAIALWFSPPTTTRAEDDPVARGGSQEGLHEVSPDTTSAFGTIHCEGQQLRLGTLCSSG